MLKIYPPGYFLNYEVVLLYCVFLYFLNLLILASAASDVFCEDDVRIAQQIQRVDTEGFQQRSVVCGGHG